MATFRLAGASLNLTPMDWSGNQRIIRAALRFASEKEIDIFCLPELCVSGYGCEDMFLSPGVRQTAEEVAADLLPCTQGMITTLGVPLEFDGDVYNAVLVAVDGKIAGIVPKQFLAGDGIHYEPRWFKPWKAGRVESAHYAGSECPLGDLVFRASDVTWGVEICRDAWVANRPGRRLVARGAQLILNPSASHFAFGKQQIRERLVMEAVTQWGVHYAFVNLLGNEAGRAIYDGDVMLADPRGVRVRSPRFSFADFAFASMPCDISQQSKSVDNIPAEDLRGETIDTGFRLRGAIAEDESTVITGNVCEGDSVQLSSEMPPGFPECENKQGLERKREEFSRAVPLALYDYMRKSRSQSAVLSLSGGADSSATAVLLWLATELGSRELGEGEVIARLSPSHSDPSLDRDAWFRQVLLCVYQSTRNSGEVTRSAAEEVARELGATFLQWSVDEHVEAYVKTVESAIGRELTWENDDIALQNIQARARAPGVWMLANIRQALLLTTSNRSEAAVGYATMDGDTCGGLAPIAGIDKAFLREWLIWMQQQGPSGLSPLHFLRVVNAQAPTAELRPSTTGQTDEADLMPYQVLDAIQRCAIRDKLMPLAVYERVSELFPEATREEMIGWVERFFRLWCRNQWKRERYAPSFHLDDQNLDPRSWCRFPILSGGYERELAILREAAQ